MSHLNIHSRPLYKDNRSDKRRVGRPRVRFRRTRWYKKNLKKKDWSYSKPTVSPRPEDERAWLNTMNQYSDAFSDICNSFIAGYYKNEEYVASSWAGKITYEKILKLSNRCFLPLPRDMEKADVENRLRYIWFQAVVRYNQRNPAVPFRNYLFRMSLFELQGWMKSIHSIHLPFHVEDNCSLNTREMTAIDWLTAEDSSFSTYERLLIYNRHVQNMSYKDIASSLYCTVDKVKATLRRISKKLFL
jgi:hypothetical protein